MIVNPVVKMRPYPAAHLRFPLIRQYPSLPRVGLVYRLFQPASSQVETVEKAFAWLRRVIVARVGLFPRITEFQPKTAGNVFLSETPTVSTQTGCGWNGWSQYNTTFKWTSVILSISYVNNCKFHQVLKFS